MLKEIKYIFYLVIVFFFFFFIIKFYFSDQYKKQSYRSYKNIDNRINKLKEKLASLESDTENIIEYVENDINIKSDKYNFWNLFKFNE